ncbi:MAG: methyltransferase domain-containing protein [Kiritimatiellae bacterium]|jgi:SAM-dependent methyltransferase|nr:methyltransferase domain-containing protein [Kiritimatiellia bacterium]
MLDICNTATTVKKSDNGIWYSSEQASISYPAEGNECCFDVEDHSFWFKHRNACITELVRAFPPDDNGPIFDIGGGNGFVSLALLKAGFCAVLVEPGQTGANNAKKRGIADVICATTQTAGFRENSLPAVGLFDVLEHIEEDRDFLRSIHGLIKKDGFLYLTVPAYNALWSNEDVHAGHFRRYGLKGLSAAIDSSGFEIVFASYIFRFLPIPIFLLKSIPSRLGFKMRSDSQRSGKRVASEHALPKNFVGRFFNRMMDAEIINISNRKKMCFGGSCLIVAKKMS